MFDAITDLNRCVFVKTSEGQQEITTKAQGLNPLQRRLLILIDGKRNAAELASMVAGQDLRGLLTLLVEKACIKLVEKSAEAVLPDGKPLAAPPLAAPLAVAAASPVLAGLPAPQSRSAREVDMARHFMINTLNMAFGNHYCVSLIEAISQSSDAEKLRQHYDAWFNTMRSSRSSAKELPILITKLAVVL